MCGRFAQALSASQYRDIVDAQLNLEREERQRRQARQRGSDASQGRQAGKSMQGSSQPGPEESTDGDAGDANPHLDMRANDDDFHPTFNVAPGSQVPVVRLGEPVPMPQDAAKTAQAEDATLVVQSMRWGLLPHYTTSIPRGPEAMRTINARDDAVLSGRSMWTPILRNGKRCVVFCQGFYEWLKKDDGAQRIAHFVGMKQEGEGRTDVDGKQRALMPMAGLYETCTVDGQQVYSFTIITTDSNKQLNFLHDRMPVVLPDNKAIRTWLGLDAASADDICSLLKPYAAGDLDVYPVPREVGKVGNNDSSFILPVSSRKDGIAAAFGRMKKQDGSPTKKESQSQSQDANSETNAPPQEEIKAIEKTGEGKKAGQAADEALARRLQLQEQKRAEFHRKRKHASGAGDDDSELHDPEKDAGPKSETKRAKTDHSETDDAGRHPSSRFSPDPFNPPVSPPRPYGGYSTVEHGYTPNKTPMQAARGGGAGTGIQSPTKSPFSPAKKRQEERFKEAAKGSKDIRNFFGGE